jgi:hypothetical protein
MNPRVALVALASLLAVLLLTGCGLEGQPFSTSTDKTTSTAKTDAALNPSVVTADAIAQYPKDSPEATALGWWRGVQTRDSESVVQSYSPEARDQLPKKFPLALVTGISPPAATSAISIADVETDGGDDATVYVVINSGDPRMSGPLALPMKKTDGEWEITDPVFLGSLADAFLATLRVSEQSAAGGGQ